MEEVFVPTHAAFMSSKRLSCQQGLKFSHIFIGKTCGVRNKSFSFVPGITSVPLWLLKYFQLQVRLSLQASNNWAELDKANGRSCFDDHEVSVWIC